MKQILHLKDDQYEYTYIDNVRYVCRGVLLNDKNEIALNKLHGFDNFGSRNYYETPGGGKKDNETLKEALLREMREETGYEVKIIKELGLVNDYYNLIHRNNRNYFYLCKAVEYVGKELENYEKSLIEEVVWVNVDEAIRLYEEMGGSGVAILVKNRELPILKKVKKILEGNR